MDASRLGFQEDIGLLGERSNLSESGEASESKDGWTETKTEVGDARAHSRERHEIVNTFR